MGETCTAWSVSKSGQLGVGRGVEAEHVQVTATFSILLLVSLFYTAKCSLINL